jgi:hypothetical protein
MTMASISLRADIFSLLFVPDKAIVASDIIACDDEGIKGKVSVTYRLAIRYLDRADPSRPSYQATSHGLPLDGKSPLSLSVEQLLKSYM